MRRILLIPIVLLVPLTLHGENKDFPLVADDLEVTLFARDPLVRNPCALAFDAKGRLCVGMGPQYRNPTPESPGDSVFILIDADSDGTADQRREFATGLNAIQGLAWRGNELWIANAPDLTIVRDRDGDDEADEYVRLYTDLGNLEHGLHGLTWAPDGRLYMSKGNSKGLGLPPDRVAPKPFRELWGMTLPGETPDFPPPVASTKSGYRKNYHDPADDWGLCGGFLRCDPDGSNLEIVARGFRNPWDIALDDGFNWLGTDNDQTEGDKFIAPFFGSHFGWGHPWSFDWKGDSHLPSAPSSGPLFEGSGTGVVYCAVPGYPDKYRDVFLVNDWLNREMLIYRPQWDGAWMKPLKVEFDRLARAGQGRSMEKSGGRSFDPVDIEIGPDGCLYVSSWGRQYGAVLENGEMANEGRIYRIRPKEFQPLSIDPKHRRPITAWAHEELVADLGHPLPVWRTNARDELVRRQESVNLPVNASRQLQTWAVWTNASVSQASDFPLEATAPENLRIQSLRILGHRRERIADIAACLRDASARIRHEAVLALHRAGAQSEAAALIDLAVVEEDRIVFYSTWQALRALRTIPELKASLGDERSGVRRAALLALLEDDALTDTEITIASEDRDAIVSGLAKKRRGGKAPGIIKGGSLAGSPPAKPALAEFPPLSVAATILPRRDGTYEEATLELGAPAFTDRPYRLREVPAELVGATFIRAANNDADPEHGTGLTLDLRYPSTVYLADDNRGKELPAWARDRFEPTGMTLGTDDARHVLFQSEYPAGPAEFGPNREGVAARKSHYLLIIRPHLVEPPESATTPESVLPLLPDADIAHGRNLFFQSGGTSCALCHRLEGRGNAFAPDLTDIGSRADADFIVRSILDPSAAITEGFAMQVFERSDGTRVAGIVLAETGRSLRLSPGGGEILEIPKTDIAGREGSGISAMPAIFHTLLRPTDVAALTRYLLTPRSSSSAGGKPATAPTESATLKPDLLAGQSFGQDTGFRIACHGDRLDLFLNAQRIASYHYQDQNVWRPFFADLTTPDGIPVTRPFPPADGDPDDHPDMHPGVSLGFADLDGVNFWHNRDGRVVHEAFSDVVADENGASFTTENRYLDNAGAELCREISTYSLTSNPDGYLLAIDTRLRATRPLRFGVKEEMGLAVRVATPMTVKFGKGTILAASGGRDEAGTWGKTDRWWDYFGPVKGRSVGVQILSAPGNPEIWSHSRDYGVLVANPFPVDIPENRNRKSTLAKNATLRLRFGVQVHDHDLSTNYNPDAAYERYLQTLEQYP